MNMCSILENYCYSLKISDIELDFLERSWLESLQKHQYLNRFPSFAPAIVCNKAGVKNGSYWITCNAAILDELRPLGTGISRSKKIFSVLDQAGIIEAA